MKDFRIEISLKSTSGYDKAKMEKTVALQYAKA